MAPPAGFMQTLLGAFTKQGAVLQPNNRALEWVTADIGFNAAPLGTVINVPVSVPVDSQVVVQTGVGYTAPTYNSYSIGTVPVTLDTLISYSVAVPSIDQINTEANLIRLLVDPALKAIENQANACITRLFTTGNFNVNAVINTTGSLITTAQFLQAKTALEMQNVDTENAAEIALLMPPLLYNNTLKDDSWSKNLFVGEAVAEDARVRGVNRAGFGASMAKDQKMPVSGTAPAQTFTSWYGRRECIAAAYRPVPAGDEKYVDAAYVNYKGFIILIEISYLGKDRVRYMNVMGAMGSKVIRPDMGQIITTAQ